MKPIAAAVLLCVALALTGCSAQKTASLVTTPQVVGMNKSQTAAVIEKAGLKVLFDKSDVAADLAPDSAVDVKSQSPAAGKKVKKGTAVLVTLELAQLTVPNEVAQTCADATVDLIAKGLTTPNTCAAGAVVQSQSPAAGTIVDALSNVTLTSMVPVVIYSVTGNARTSNVITFTKPGTTDIEQASDAPLPWSMTFPEPSADAIDNFESVSAQDESGTSISCSITDDGTVVDSETATGRYAIVQCSNG